MLLEGTGVGREWDEGGGVGGMGGVGGGVEKGWRGGVTWPWGWVTIGLALVF